jgi:hypothetical protein
MNKNLIPISEENRLKGVAKIQENAIKRAEFKIGRSTFLKEIMQRPLTDLMKYSKDFKEYCNENFDNPSELLVAEAFEIATIISYFMQADKSRFYTSINAELFGKVKEQSESKRIELPQMIDPIEMAKSLDKATLLMLLDLQLNEPAKLESPQ